jgi:hypothetical protein
MVAKIGRGNNLIGALSYNHRKVEKENGHVLSTQKMIELPDGSYSIAQLSRSFEPYLIANRKTEKPVLHISLNPDPSDILNDNDFRSMAEEYMQRMGYGKQPYVVFKHTDIERTHIHIVSVCVDEQGKKISDSFEKRRSMDVCRELERQYDLKSAVEKKQKQTNPTFKPVNYKAGDIKSQMASVLRYLPRHYQYTTLGAYNALLSLFNITAEEVNGKYNGTARQGLVYFALNEKGEKASNPFKASLFGKSAGYKQMQLHFNNSIKQLQDSPDRIKLKTTIEKAIQETSTEKDFKGISKNSGINTVVRRTADKRIYGITFIDHQSRSVWNGSQLAKNLSAGVFNDWWNKGIKPKIDLQIPDLEKLPKNINPEISLDKFLENKSNQSFPGAASALSDIFGGWLPQAQGEDYEEEAFARQMKKRSRGRKR